MKHLVRPFLMAAVALTLFGMSSLAVSQANATVSEVNLNSSTVQVVHNSAPNSDVLNMSLNVTNNGDNGTGDCNGGLNDFLEAGFLVAVSRFSCATFFSSCIGICPDFEAEIDPVEHEIGSSAYGTFFGPSGAGSIAVKIVALVTPPNTCGTWSINLQATGQNLSLVTGPQVALFLIDADFDAGPFFGAACFDVNVNVGTGITKPHHGVHSVRHH
jgi:hypothetical protein